MCHENRVKPIPFLRNICLRNIPIAVWGIAGLAVLLRLGIAAATQFTQEDALITLRYAENIARGQGFAYNPGERVLGTTTPLYTLLLALASWLGLPALATGKVVNIGADGLLCVALFRWLRAAGWGRAGYVAAFLAAVNPIAIRVAISGQEAALAALLGALAWAAYAEGRPRAAFCAGAALFLVRWDGLLLLAVLTGAVVWRERRFPWREWGVALALAAPWLLFAMLYFGSPIPVTLAAKAVVYGWASPDTPLPELHKLLFRLFGTPTYALTALAAGFGLWRVVRARQSALIAPTVWFVLYWGAFLVSKVLLFEWYLVPPLPVYTLLAAVGVAGAVTPRLAVRLPAVAGRAALGVLASALVVLGGRSAWRSLWESQQVEDHLRRPLGLWLRAHSRPGDRIMLEPIGYIGYYSGRPVLDVVGLVTPAVLPFYRRDDPAPLLSMAQAFRPEWCVLRPEERGRIERAAETAGQSWPYMLVGTFSYASRPTARPATFLVFRRTEAAP